MNKWQSYVGTREQLCDTIANHKIVTHTKGHGKNKESVMYYNVTAAFDIETTSFIYEGNKIGAMYIWMFSVAGVFYYGRTWESFVQLLEYISEELELSMDKRVIIYVHNLSYEFQFLRKWLKWYKVFALDRLTPAYAVSDLGFEFRCSYLLSGLSLEKTAENLQKYKVEKLVGNLDYRTIRGNNTPLSEKEMMYCLNDVLVVNAFIQEKIEEEGDITKIPLTNTGYVRRFCRKKCLYEQGEKKYRNRNYDTLMRALTLDIDTYEQMNRAFMGGFTHANYKYIDRTLEDVKSFDLTSAYPSVIVYEKFPMSMPITIDDETANKHFQFYLDNYCCVFDIEFINIVSTQYEQILSKSKCFNFSQDKECEHQTITNNGRVVSSPHVITTLTEIDYMWFKKFYDWDEMRISNLRVFEKQYLPKELVTAIMALYQDKTKLKGLVGKEEEYLRSKGMLNSAYGMMVMKIIRDEVTYDDIEGWGVVRSTEHDEDDIRPGEHQINRYNTSMNRFLYFPWGVWVTAYARQNLYRGIIELGEDYVYCDTDSLKFINWKTHIPYFEKFNKDIEAKLKAAMSYHELDYSLCSPKTNEGKVKMLGEWDDDGNYVRFKTLGAKRYLVESWEKGKLNVHMTVAGCSKKLGCKYLLETFGQPNVFDAFSTDLVIPKGKSGRLIHHYSSDEDEEYTGEFIDYKGNVCTFHEKSFVYLEEAEYTLNRANEFKDFLRGVMMLEED